MCCQDEIGSSQAAGEVFGGAAWQSLLADLEPCADDVLRKFSVRAMLHKVSILLCACQSVYLLTRMKNVSK